MMKISNEPMQKTRNVSYEPPCFNLAEVAAERGFAQSGDVEDPRWENDEFFWN